MQVDLRQRLQALGRRVRNHLLAEGLARVVAVAFVVALLTYVLDRTLRLGLTARLILSAAAVAVLVWQAWRSLIRPLRLSLAPIDLAALLDRRPGEVALTPLVASVLQLPQLPVSHPAASPAMVRLAVERAHARLGQVNFADRLDINRFTTLITAIAVLVLAPTVLALAWPGEASLWARRWFAGSGQAWPQQTYLRVVGLQNGKLLVPRGESSVLRVLAVEQSVDPQAVSVDLLHGGISKTATMSHFAPRDWRYDLPPLQTRSTIEIQGNDESLGPIVVEPVDRPRIVAMQLLSKHPAEAKPQVRTFGGQEADLAYLPETSLELRFSANVPIAQAAVKNSGPVPKDDALRRVDDRTFVLAWEHKAAARLQIELTGAAGNLASAPMPLAIDLKTDTPPRVTVQFSGVRSRVTPSARIPLNVQARDDYGLAKLDLLIRPEPLSASATQPASVTQPAAAREVPLMEPAKPATALEVQRKHVLNVADQKLAPGAALVVAAAATDNRWGSPQAGQSRNLSFRIVAPEELFREILLRQQGERAKLRKLIDDAQKLHDDLATSTTPAALAPLARQHRLHQREASRLATSLAESLLEMQLNALGGQEAYDLMQNKIIQPLRALSDGQMAQQRDALDALSRAEDAASLAQIGPRQAEIVEQLRNVLKQMNQWDSFVDVLNQLNEVIKLQERVKKTTEDVRKGQEESIFEK